MKERYPGTIGSTQGETNETRPARNAAAIDTEEVMLVSSGGSADYIHYIGAVARNPMARSPRVCSTLGDGGEGPLT